MLRRGKHSNPAASAAASDLFGDKPPDPLSTTDGCWCAAVGLFSAIERTPRRHRGEAHFPQSRSPIGSKAQKAPGAHAASVSRTSASAIRIQRQQQAARYISEHNAKLRLGPSGSTSEDALRRYLGRLIDDYPDEAISKLLRELKSRRDPAKTRRAARQVPESKRRGSSNAEHCQLPIGHFPLICP